MDKAEEIELLRRAIQRAEFRMVDAHSAELDARHDRDTLQRALKRLEADRG